MQDMIDFSTAMLTALADFLKSEPISYLFGMILFKFIVKIFMILCGRRKAEWLLCLPLLALS